MKKCDQSERRAGRKKQTEVESGNQTMGTAGVSSQMGEDYRYRCSAIDFKKRSITA